MIALSLDLISGLTMGLEHVSGDEDDEYLWAVVLHLGLFRIVFMKYP